MAGGIKLEASRIIVTGGAGFIGSALVRHLVNKQRCTVLTLDKLSYAGCLASLREVDSNSRHQFLKADIRDAQKMSAVIEEFQPDQIMHLAAESHVDRSISGPMEFLDTNVMGTAVLLEVARNYWSNLPSERQEQFRFLHVSTDEVYGSLGEVGLFYETTAYDPSSPYSASKAASDHLVKAWARTYGLPVVVTNCSNNYGPYHFPEKLIPLTILNALEGKNLPVYGDGKNIRDWLYVEDHVQALDLIIRRGRLGETYNVGGYNERTNIDVVGGICRILDKIRPTDRPHDELITFVDDRPGHDARYAIDCTKLESELGWRPNRDFENGLLTTVEWYLANDWWWRPLRERYEGQRLGVL